MKHSLGLFEGKQGEITFKMKYIRHGTSQRKSVFSLGDPDPVTAGLRGFRAAWLHVTLSFAIKKEIKHVPQRLTTTKWIFFFFLR